MADGRAITLMAKILGPFLEDWRHDVLVQGTTMHGAWCNERFPVGGVNINPFQGRCSSPQTSSFEVKFVAMPESVFSSSSEPTNFRSDGSLKAFAAQRCILNCYCIVCIFPPYTQPPGLRSVCFCGAFVCAALPTISWGSGGGIKIH
ncbi:hypothetical protein I7I48_10170 [Histoplasma ohiense]|nr:hypothetical protein I7I48_10170 [Histoplasma ohiense (nom. inval.)]